MTNVQATADVQQATAGDFVSPNAEGKQSLLASRVALEGTRDRRVTSESAVGTFGECSDGCRSGNCVAPLEETACGIDRNKQGAEDQSATFAPDQPPPTARYKTQPSHIDIRTGYGTVASLVTDTTHACCLSKSPNASIMTWSGKTGKRCSPNAGWPNRHCARCSDRELVLKDTEIGTQTVHGSPRPTDLLGVHLESAESESSRHATQLHVNKSALAVDDPARSGLGCVSKLPSTQACEDVASDYDDEEGRHESPVNTCGPASVKRGTCPEWNPRKGAAEFIAAERWQLNVQTSFQDRACDSEPHRALRTRQSGKTFEKGRFSDTEICASDSISPRSQRTGVDVTGCFSRNKFYSKSECVEVQQASQPEINKSSLGVPVVSGVQAPVTGRKVSCATEHSRKEAEVGESSLEQSNGFSTAADFQILKGITVNSGVDSRRKTEFALQKDEIVKPLRQLGKPRHITDDVWPNVLLRHGGCLSKPRLSPRQVTSVSKQALIGTDQPSPNCKRLCKSLSNLTADDLLSEPCSSIYSSTSSVGPLSCHQPDGSNMISRSRIAKLITGHVRPTQQTEHEANVSAKHHVNDRSNGVSKSKGVSKQVLPDKAISETSSRDGLESTSSSTDRPCKASSGSRRVPKLPRSLFPFMRKDRKRQNNGHAIQSGPLKARGITENSSDSSLVETNPPVGIANSENHAVAQANATPTVGFRKLKVDPTPTRRNVHDDYATRVARMSRTASSSQKTDSPYSSLQSSASLCNAKKLAGHKMHKSTGDLLSVDPAGLISTRPPRHKNKQQLSAAPAPMPRGVGLHSSARRPSSFAGGELNWRDGSQETSDDQTNSTEPMTRNGAERTQKHGWHRIGENADEIATKQPKITVRCPVYRQDDQPRAVPESEERRRSLNVDILRYVDIHAQLSFLASLPGPETNINGSRSGSLTGSSTPCSAILMPRCPSGLRLSLASSLASIVTEEQIEKMEFAGCQPQPEENTEKSETISTSNPLSLRLRRAQSLCKERVTPLTLQISQPDRRSVSPSFGESLFADARSRTGDAHPKKLERRIQSLRDFNAVRNPQPNKPTTPKPRKMSAGWSSSSLNRFSFQHSLQNLSVAGQQQCSCTSLATTPITTGLRSGAPNFETSESRQKSLSAKNASIRRRMSLQLTKTRSREVEGDASSQNRDSLDNNVWKRHSIGCVEIDKLRSAMTRSTAVTFSVSPENGAINNKRKTRPLSEVHNVRWEVHAIPENHEVALEFDEHELDVHAQRTKSLYLSSSTAPPAHHMVCCHSSTPCLRESDGVYGRAGLVGSSFSEEDISMTSDEEFFGTLPRTQKSLSVIGGLNAMPRSVLHFYPSKYYVEATCPCRGPSHRNGAGLADHLTPFGHGLHHFFETRSKVRGSTTSGISNESGYETMTRKGAYTKNSEPDEEEVFLQSNSRKCDDNAAQAQNQDVVVVEALWDHVTMDNEELGFKVGDVIRVTDFGNEDWWWGQLDGREGWFPATFVRILVNQQFNDEIDIIITPSPDSPTDDESSMTPRDPLRPASSASSDLCQCSSRHSNSSVHCAACGRPLKSGPSSPRTDRKKQATFLAKHSVSVATPSPARKVSLNRDTIRMNVVNEIINSEKVYVGHLKDVIEGYLARCRKRPDMFTDEQIATLFGNIEQVYQFQKGFYTTLEAAVDRSCIHASQLGHVFVEHKEGFGVYSDYCNNHPQALAQLSGMLILKKYVHFLEACRLLQKMIDIPLDGFLLTPVQKICKYPLQLAELLKYTHAEHSDHGDVVAALEVMKDVAGMINERKRQMENIKKISMWQSTILNWQDEDVLLRSRELVHSGEIYTVSQSKNKVRMAFLFDHQLILCKKDILRRDLLYYKRRINLDETVATDLASDSSRSNSLTASDVLPNCTSSQRGWVMTDVGGKTVALLCKNDEEYQRWSKAFEEERKIAVKERISLSPAEDALVQQSAVPALRKPKESTSLRMPLSYRQRVKMATQLQGAAGDVSTKTKNLPLNGSGEKSAGFFSNMAGRLTPFRRANATRESSVVF